MNQEKIYYVYAWYIKSTNEIFHVGKGKNNRCYDIKNHRNKYFINTYNVHKDDCDVKILYDNLTEQEAFALEKELIEYYKSIGQCKTNLHEGGCGGNTGNYETVGQKVSEYRKTHDLTESQRMVIKAMNEKVRGTHQTEEHRQNESIAAKKSWENKQSDSNQKRLANLKKFAFQKGQQSLNAGKKLSDSTIAKMLKNNPNTKLYQVYYNDELIYWCYGHTRLINYCHETFNISKTIVFQIINNTWDAHFNKHKHLKNSLKILALNESVSTTGDECNQVEWRKQPFEVRGPVQKGEEIVSPCRNTKE